MSKEKLVRMKVRVRCKVIQLGLYYDVLYMEFEYGIFRMFYLLITNSYYHDLSSSKYTLVINTNTLMEYNSYLVGKVTYFKYFCYGKKSS